MFSFMAILCFLRLHDFNVVSHERWSCGTTLKAEMQSLRMQETAISLATVTATSSRLGGAVGLPSVRSSEWLSPGGEWRPVHRTSCLTLTSPLLSRLSTTAQRSLPLFVCLSRVSLNTRHRWPRDEMVHDIVWYWERFHTFSLVDLVWTSGSFVTMLHFQPRSVCVHTAIFKRQPKCVNPTNIANCVVIWLEKLVSVMLGTLIRSGFSVKPLNLTSVEVRSSSLF